MNRILLMVLIIPLISGCAFLSKKPTVNVTTTHIQVCANAPQIDKLNLLEVMPYAVKDDIGIYWIGLTPKGYENLAINIQKLKQVIEQQKAVIQYYESCVQNRKENNANN